MRRRGTVSSPLLLQLRALHIIGQRRRCRLHVAVEKLWTQRGVRLLKPGWAIIRVIGLIVLEQLLGVAATLRRILLIEHVARCIIR